MKKITAMIILIIGVNALLCSSAASTRTTKLGKEQFEQYSEWSGTVRIEGESQTVWKGSVAFSNSSILVENMETHEMELHEIPYPSAIGALDEASKQGGFPYTVVYYPSFDAMFVISIGDDATGDKTGWVYFVDYEIIMISADKYELTEENSDVLLGFLYFETWETLAHALKISTDKTIVNKDEEFTVSVTDETGTGIEEAIVYIDSSSFTTNGNGEVTISLDIAGTYKIYAEKDPAPEDSYIRSGKISIKVKKSKTNPFDLTEKYLMLNCLLHFNLLKMILNYH